MGQGPMPPLTAAYHFLRSVAEGIPHGATLDDAVRSAALDAMLSSAEREEWASLAEAPSGRFRAH
jgi:hypothetical protein